MRYKPETIHWKSLCLPLIFIITWLGEGFTQSNPQDSLIDLQAYFEKNDIQATKIQDGLFVNINEPGKGSTPQTGDYVMVNFTGRLLDGSIFDKSEKGMPFVFQLGYRQVIAGWELGIPHFVVGSKGQLFIDSDLAYGNSDNGSVPGGSALVFDIELLELMDLKRYDEFMIELEKKERQLYEKQVEAQFQKDKKIIQDYLLKNKIKAKRTESGLSYNVRKKGKGAFPEKGDKITVHYEGYFANGEQFDSSFKREPYTFVLGKRQAIKAWEEGIHFFNKGSEGWILLPSKLGYGPEPVDGEDWTIPGNTVLIFKIKVLSIEKPVVTTAK